VDEAVDQDGHTSLHAKAVFETPAQTPTRSFLDVMLPAAKEYVFFALGCTAATSVLRASRFNCAAQLWLLASVQGYALVVLLARKPYTVPAKNVLSIVSAALTGAAFVCLAIDSSASEGHSGVKALGQSLAAIASLMSYPTLAITLGRRLLLVYWLRRASEAADVADAVDVEDCLIDAALLGHRIFDENHASFNVNVVALPASAIDVGLELVAPDSISEVLLAPDSTSEEAPTGTGSQPAAPDVEVDEEGEAHHAGIDGMRFTRHAQDGDDQVDWTRLNPLRRTTKPHAVPQADDFTGAAADAEAARRRSALAAIAAVDDADDAVMLL
jgi:hypothetical protein